MHDSDNASASSPAKSSVGVIVIGRNEGERLCVCLDSLRPQADTIVYVDSASTDDSLANARERGADVVELDMSLPFSAARARNAGMDRLRELHPDVAFVQFVDGDCEVAEDWIAKAQSELMEHPECAAVWGHLEERFPDASVYNKLASMEWNWDLPFGDVRTFGGIVMIRAHVIGEAGGYNPAIIAGEERDLAARILEQGHTIRRIDALMVRHDAAMTKFSQWWKRSIRGGHAYAEGNLNRRHEKERYWQREMRSIWIWGAIVPLVILVIALLHPIISVGLSLLYPLQFIKICRYMRGRGYSLGDAATYSFFLVLAKFPNALGAIQFHKNRLLSRDTAIIEYK